MRPRFRSVEGEDARVTRSFLSPALSLRQAPDATSAGCCIGIGRALCPAEHVERRVHDPTASLPAALRRPRVCEPSGGASVRSCSRGPRLRDSWSRSPGRTGVPPVPRRSSLMPLVSSAPGLDGDDEGCLRCRSERRTTAFRVARWVVSSVSKAVSRLPVALAGLCIGLLECWSACSGH
jgi:hypothetical protein